MHKKLRLQLEQARGESGDATDLDQLLALVDEFYCEQDKERDKAERTIQMISDNLAALGEEIREARDNRLQAILDNVKDAIFTLDEDGSIRIFNPTGERIFGFSEDELRGRSLELLIPEARGRVSEFLSELAALSNTMTNDLLSWETQGKRKNGDLFSAELAISETTLKKKKVFIGCLRDISQRKEIEKALRTSEARFRSLVENAPEAIVVLDLDEVKFVDANENAVKLFKMSREDLLEIGPAQLSPPVQPDGRSSFETVAEKLDEAKTRGQTEFEWTHRDAEGNDLQCEVRLSRLPGEDRNLVRGSISDITVRKRAELIAQGEKKVLERMASGAPLSLVLATICLAMERVTSGIMASVLLGGPDKRVKHVAAPSLPDDFISAVDKALLGPGEALYGKAVYQGRQLVVSDIEHSALMDSFRNEANALRLRSCWTVPFKTSDEETHGAFVFYRRKTGAPEAKDIEAASRLSRLAAIAVERASSEEALRESEARFRGLFESVVDGVYRSSADGKILAANPALVSMLGYKREEDLKGLSKAVELYVNPLEREALIKKLDEEGIVRNFEYQLLRKNGDAIVVLENARAVRDAHGKVVAYEGTITDITERKKNEMAVFKEKERAQVTLQSIGDAVITTDADGQVDYLNPVAESLTGWELEQAKGAPIEAVFHLINERNGETANSPVRRCLEQGDVVELEEGTALVSREGKQYSIQDSAAPIRDRNGNVLGVVVVFHDVSKERRLRRALSYQASHDSLTGLENRRQFEQRFTQLLENGDRNSRRYHVLLYMDIDQLKIINDSMGHAAGDHLIKQASKVIKSKARDGDFLARFNGDEFALVLVDCDLANGEEIAEKLRDEILNSSFEWEDESVSVTASIGLVTVTPEDDSVAQLLSAADVACFAAKDGGRNQVRCYHNCHDSSERHEEMKWVSRIKTARDDGRLELFFQPIVAVEGDEQDVHCELLLRMRDKEGRLIMPDVFIPAAERFNLMHDLDRWVINHVLSEVHPMVKKQTNGQGITLAINLSGTSLNNNGFLNYVLDQFAEYDVPPGDICFEITETAAINNLSSVVHLITRLKNLGCRFSLDDFGSGLSSFTYLKTLPVDYLKIDGHFITNLATDKIDQAMVRAICEVGHTMEIKTVAERVEDQATMLKLAEIGVDYAQGYHIARPAPVSEFALSTGSQSKGKSAVHGS
ncbi:MAG: PAS domain S-box protein [Gammaproteobacteria bacterium]|nr:PAS domain S-box protein [Gammaproteobacteria bacterium]